MHTVLSIVAVLGVGSIAAALISWRVSISNHRQDWINALRDDVVIFLRDLEAIHGVIDKMFRGAGKYEENEQSRVEARLAVLMSYWRVVLRLNRTEKMHVELRDKLNALMEVKEKTPDRTKVEEMVDLARRVFKREWEVTKYGFLAGPVLWAKEGNVNWKLGILRLWAVGATTWILAVPAVGLYRWYYNPWRAAEIEPPPGSNGPVTIIPFWTTFDWCGSLLAALAPPTMLLAFGAACWWAANGFNKQRRGS